MTEPPKRGFAVVVVVVYGKNFAAVLYLSAKPTPLNAIYTLYSLSLSCWCQYLKLRTSQRRTQRELFFLRVVCELLERRNIFSCATENGFEFGSPP